MPCGGLCTGNDAEKVAAPNGVQPMNKMKKELLLGVIQLGLVLSLGGKLLYDRMTRPRVWVLGLAYDPELPLRGRYLSEQLRLPAEGFTYQAVDRNRYDWLANR